MEEMAQALQQLRLLAERQAQQINALQTGAVAAAVPSVVVQQTAEDSLRLGKPASFKGEEAQFDDWDLKFRAWLGSQDRRIADELIAAKQRENEQPWSELSEAEQQRSSKVHYALIMLCEDSALRIVRAAGDNGYEGYRLMCRRFDPQSKSRSLARLNVILAYSFGTKPDELLDRILGWERLIGDYEGDSKEMISDSLRSAVLVGNLPPAIRTHILMNPTATQDYAALKALIESYITSGRRWDETVGTKSSQQGPSPMEIDVIKGKGKKKGKASKGKGKDKGKKGKNKNQEQTTQQGEQPAQGSAGAATPAAASTGKGAKKFSGYCGNCGKWGAPTEGLLEQTVWSAQPRGAGGGAVWRWMASRGEQ